MNTRLFGMGLAALALLAAPRAHAQGGPPAFEDDRLRPQTREYRVVAQGNPVGQSATTLSREGDGWKAEMALQFGPVRQTITARWGAAWAPLDYRETYAGAFEGSSEVRLADGRFTGSATMPQQAGGNKTFDAAAVPGAAWSLMDEAMLSTADLAEGKTIVIPFFNTSTGAVAPVTYMVGTVESVTVPAGTFQAYRVESTGGSSPLVLWMRAEGPHVVVRQEVVGQPFVIELTAIR
jgi:hypothetical protein